MPTFKRSLLENAAIQGAAGAVSPRLADTKILMERVESAETRRTVSQVIVQVPIVVAGMTNVRERGHLALGGAAVAGNALGALVVNMWLGREGAPAAGMASGSATGGADEADLEAELDAILAA